MAMLETTYRDFKIQRPRLTTHTSPEQNAADDDLEALIDEAGRDEVFAYAVAAGWSIANPPEKWVWRQMAHEVLRMKAEASDEADRQSPIRPQPKAGDGVER